MNDLPWWTKASIGAIGGLVLAMLKLIDAKFFLSATATVEAYAAYLTYACYVVLGSVAAVFLADHELPPQKIRRSAFILGLLAPSILLAIANQPFRPAIVEQMKPISIPSLGWLPISGAFAASVDSGVADIGGDAGSINILPKSSLQPSFGEAVSAALGRTTLTEPYVLIVGSTDDKEKAQQTAVKLKSYLTLSGLTDARLSPRVVQLQGGTKYFVLMGNVTSQQALFQIKADATALAVKGISSETKGLTFSPNERSQLTRLLANAPVVPATAMAREP